MARYDLELVKQAAAGQWPHVIASLCGLSPSILDGQHHPCPRCGGKDRFNLSREKAGSLHCNKCQPGTGDGIASVMWLNGWDFKKALEEVAAAVNVQPEKRPRKTDPAQHLEFMPWNPTVVGLWCLKKKPIKPEAVEAIGGRVARYREQYTVIAIPVWGPAFQDEDPVGWVVYRADGKELPKGPRDNIEWVKVKLTAGSQAGIIAASNKPDSDLLWKTEGPTDLMTLLSVSPDVDAFTTANGAMEKPLEWIVKFCEGKVVNVIHDADNPGQDGATWVPIRGGQKRPGWCPTLATTAKEVRNVTLSFPVESTHGPDLRDFFAGGGSFDALLERAADAEVFSDKTAAEKAAWVDESEDDPQRLARVNLDRYRSEHDGRLLYWRDEWWKWKEGRYRRIEPSELKAKVWAAVRAEFETCWRERLAKGDDKPIRKVTRALVSNVIGAMESICSVASSLPMPCWMPDRSQPHYLATSNGILDLDAIFAKKSVDESLLPHSPDWFSPFRLDYPFDPEADCPKWIDYLDYCMDGDQERINLLQEWAGYLLTSTNDLQRFLVLEGDGGNGKTVYFAAMTAMLGEDNVSHVSIENFDGRFELGTTIGKSANISGDAGEIDSVAEGVLKQFTGGDIMQFDRKNQTPISARPTAKLMAAWNSRPRIRDKSMGLWRRMLLVPFLRSIPAERKILGMDKPAWWIEQGEAPGILNWAIVGLYRLRQQHEFTKSKISAEAMAEYREDSNPTGEFFSDYIEPADESSIEIGWLYELYTHWCKKNGCHPLGNRQFGKEIKRKFPHVERKRIRDGRNLSWKLAGISFSTEEIFSKSVEKENSLF